MFDIFKEHHRWQHILGKEKYGIDLLKKKRRQAVDNLRQAPGAFHRVPERTVWQDTRGLLFGVAREARGP